MEHRSGLDPYRRGDYRGSGYRGGSRGGFRGGSTGASWGASWGPSRFKEKKTWQKDSPPYYTKAPAVPVTPQPEFGPLISTIAVSDIQVDKNQLAAITDCELAGSFNWLDSKEPSVLIPGGPPRWTPLARSTLYSDSGTYFRDINSARLPLHPMEPLVDALCQSQHGHDAKTQPGMYSDIDIVACGYTLGNLLRFIRRDELAPNTCKSFRIVAHLVGRDSKHKDRKATLFLVRRENSPDECIPGVFGFGHEFCESYTTWDAATKASVSHQRVLKYRFGGLDILFRSEADGYMQEKLASTDEPTPASEATGIDEIDNLFASLGMGTQPASGSAGTHANAGAGASASTGGDGLQVRYGGKLIPQSSVFDIKTRSVWKRAQTDEMLEQEMPRLWYRQLSTFVLALHEKGVFSKENIEIIDVRSSVKEWEQTHQEPLKKLAGLLRMILDKVKGLERGTKLEICCTEEEGSDALLELREPGPGAMDALSQRGQHVWTGQHGDAEDSGNDGHGSDDGACDIEDKYSDNAWSDSDSGERDYTACSSSDCGYCGKCRY